MLRYQEFLNKVIDESKLNVMTDFGRSHREGQADSKDIACIQGALAGLEACRNCSPPQLSTLLERAAQAHHKAFHQTILNRYWRLTCFLFEVEWICNVVSVVLANQGMEEIVPPTIKAALMAQQIVNGSDIN